MHLLRKLTAAFLSAALIAGQFVISAGAFDTFGSSGYDGYSSDIIAEDGSLTAKALDILEDDDIARQIEEKVLLADTGSDVDTIEVALTEEELEYIEAVDAKQHIDSSSDVAVFSEYIAAKSQYATDYFYDQMNYAEKDLYDKLYTACYEFMYSNTDLTTSFIGKGIDFNTSVMTLADARVVVRLFYYSNPQFFFLKNGYGYGPTSNPTHVMPLANSDFYSASVRNTYRNRINSITSSWMNEIDSAPTTLSKQAVIYKKLCEHIDYVHTSKDQSIAGALVDGECVCNGYALAAEYFCNAAGIECICAKSETHAWNIIRLYGKWYEFDVTWMDQTTYIWARWLNKSHSTFLKNDSNSSHVYKLADFGRFVLPDTKYDTVSEEAATVGSITLQTLPTKTEYAKGESLDLTGGVIMANYTDGTGQKYSMKSSSVAVTGYDPDKTGKQTLTVTYGGKTLTFTVTVLPGTDAEKNVAVRTSSDSEPYYAESLSSAFEYIDALASKTTVYSIELLKDITEDTLTFPTYAKGITLSGNEQYTLTVPYKLLPKTSLTVDCAIVSSNGKAIDITMPASSTLEITDNADIRFGTVTGKSTAVLITDKDTEAESIVTFKQVTVNNDAVLTVNTKMTGITNLSGCVRVTSYGTSNTVKITNISSASLLLTMGKVSGNDAVAPVTVNKITGSLEITVTDKDGNIIDLEPGLKIANSGTATDISSFITVVNTDSKGGVLSPKQTNKVITAESTGQTEENVLVTGSKGFSGHAGDLNGAFALIDSQADKNQSYTIELLTDIEESALTFPTYTSGITITGEGKLTLAAALTKLLPKTSVTIDTVIVNAGNKVIAVTMPAKSVLTIDANADIKLGAITGKSTASLVINKDTEAVSAATFKDVTVSEGAVFTVTNKISGITALTGTVKMTGFKTSNTAKITTADKAAFILTMGKVSGKDAVAPLTVNKISEELVITVVDAKDEPAVLEKDMVIAKAGTTTNITDKITVTNTDNNGDPFTLKQDEKKNIILQSGNTVIEQNVLITGSDGYTEYANDLGMAFEMINAHANKKADYEVELLVDISEDALTFPTNAASVTLTGEGKLTLAAKLVKLLPKTSLTVDTAIVNEKNKAVAFTMPAKSVLTIGAGADVNFGAITGKSTAELNILADTAAASIATFKNVNIANDAILTVSGKISGVTGLSGTVKITGYKTSNSAKITNIGNAHFILTMGKVSGKDAVAALTVTKIADGLTLTVADAKGSEAEIASEMKVALSAKTDDISDKIIITNTESESGEPFVAMQFDKEIRAISPKDAPKLDLNGKKYYSWSEMIADITDDSKDQTITLLDDYDIGSALKLPTSGFRTLALNGNGHTLTFIGTSVKLSSDLSVSDITLTAVNKSGTAVKYTITCRNYKLTAANVEYGLGTVK